MAVWTVTDRVLRSAPGEEARWAEGYLESLTTDQETAAKIGPDVRKRLEDETRKDAVYHAQPYRWYLPYCLVNYAVYAALLITVFLYAVLPDRQRLIEEQQGSDQILVNQRAHDRDVDREFQRFYDVCFRHTQRYINLLLWMSIIIVFEFVVTRKTMSEHGWRYELMTSAVVGLCTLVWVGIVVHFYEGAFRRCCDEKRRRGRLTEKWEHSCDTTRFLAKYFLNVRSGVAVGTYLMPIVIIIAEVTFQ